MRIKFILCVSLLCGAFSVSAVDAIEPSLANYQNVPQTNNHVIEYRNFINKGVVPYNWDNNLVRHQFIANVIKWTLIRKQNTHNHVKFNLDKNSWLAKLLIKRRLLIQGASLLRTQNSFTALSRLCQTRFDDVFALLPTLPQNLQNLKIERLSNHARIWWAMLSIQRTKGNYDLAWSNLELVQSPPYTRVARLWQAHLILVNHYSPTANATTDRAEARRLLESLQMGPRNHSANVLLRDLTNYLNNANENAETPPHNVQNGAIAGDAEVPPGPEDLNEGENHPPFLPEREMRALQSELWTELVRQERSAQLLENPEVLASHFEDDDHNPQIEGGDSSSDDNDDDDDNLYNLGEGIWLSRDENGQTADNVAQEVNNHEEATNESFNEPASPRAATNVNEHLAQFLSFRPREHHTIFDYHTVRFLKTGIMDAYFVELLARRYAHITLNENHMRREKKAGEFEQFQKALPVVRLVHHYSRSAVKEQALSEYSIQLFKKWLPTDSRSNLSYRYHLPHCRDVSALYLQFLAYREEINTKQMGLSTVTERFNALHHVSVKGSFVIPGEENASHEEIQRTLDDYRTDPGKLLGKNAKRIRSLKILWAHLPTNELPPRELGAIEDFYLQALRPEEEAYLRNLISTKDLTTNPARKETRIEFNKKFNIACTDKKFDRFIRELAPAAYSKEFRTREREFFETNQAESSIINYSQYRAAMKGTYGASLSQNAFHSRLGRYRSSKNKTSSSSTIEVRPNKKRRSDL